MAAASAAMHGLAGALDSVMPPDKRTDEEYLAEVERYLASCRAYYTQLALSRYAASDAALMRLRLANASDRNYTDVQVQIHIAGKVSARKYSEIVWLPMGRTSPTSTNADVLTGLPNTYVRVRARSR